MVGGGGHILDELVDLLVRLTLAPWRQLVASERIECFLRKQLSKYPNFTTSYPFRQFFCEIVSASYNESKQRLEQLLNVPRDSNAIAKLDQVVGMIEVLGIEQGVAPRVGRRQSHMTPTLGTHRTHVNLVRMACSRLASVVVHSSWQKVKLHVRMLHLKHRRSIPQISIDNLVSCSSKRLERK